MIYLATPYTHPDPAVRERRYKDACRVTSDLMRKGHKIFSPIAHSHGINVYGLPGNWEFWKDYDTEFLKVCTELWVVMMPGWKESVGVNAEIKIAQDLGKPVKYLEFEDAEAKA